MIAKINKIKACSWEDNKIDKPLDRLMKKKWRRLKSTELEMKKRSNNWHCRNTKDHERLLWAIICQ